jgi:hypothetical protein
MYAEPLLKRFPTIARMLLACHCEAIGEANARWLELRLEHNEWDPRDRIRLQEMMPAAATWLLSAGDDK